MGYTIEKVEQKKCMSIWGDRPPSRAELEMRAEEALAKNIENMLTVSDMYFRGDKGIV